ncbi:MAG: HAD-IB family phosphatase [Methanomassiliicoccales archaeon]|nr:MAG: HAD-IB family phosphatase [Methanomassiliicoccales archaeon]
MNGRRYDLVAFDMDGVLIDYPSTWTWVHDHFGVRNRESVDAFLRGEIDDLEFMRKDISLWIDKRPGICRGDLEKILWPVPLMKGLEETVSAIKASGAKCVIVSGGLDTAAERIADRFGFDGFLANGFECSEDGRLTGQGVLRVMLKSKMSSLMEFQRRFGIRPERTASIGDSFIDVSMFELSALKIAFNPIDELVVGRADHVIREKDLRLVLPYILGPSLS